MFNFFNLIGQADPVTGVRYRSKVPGEGVERAYVRLMVHLQQWNRTPRASGESRQVKRRYARQYAKQFRTHNVSGLEIPERSRGISV